MDSLSLERCASLRKHKALPRSRVVPEKMISIKVTGIMEPKRLAVSGGKPTVAAWNPGQHDIKTTPSLPITPPISTADEKKLNSDSSKSVDIPRPPTPDTTPVKKATKKLSLTPPPILPYESSAAASFITACENPYSSEDDSQLYQSAVSGYSSAWSLESGVQVKNPNSVGLGLDLESEDEGQTTPVARSPTIQYTSGSEGISWGQFQRNAAEDVLVAEDPHIVVEPAAVQELGGFDLLNSSPSPSSHNTPKSLTKMGVSEKINHFEYLVRRHERASEKINNSDQLKNGPKRASMDIDDADELENRYNRVSVEINHSDDVKNGHNRVSVEINHTETLENGNTRNIDQNDTGSSPPTYHFSQQPQSPKEETTPCSLDIKHSACQSPEVQAKSFIDLKVQETNAKRLSQLSSRSTIVEAMVLENPLQKPQVLRHSAKNASLRSVSSPENSNRSSLNSSDLSSPLRHKKACIFLSGNRTSMISDNSIGGIEFRSNPRAVSGSRVPQRRSSLKGTFGPGHPAMRKTPHVEDLRSSSRPATAPDAGIRNAPALRHRSRRMSESSSRRSPDKRDTRTIDFAPVIPHRSSSLSAPTSRNVSRTTSLTSKTPHTLGADAQMEMPRNSGQLLSTSLRRGSSGISERRNTDELLDLQHRSLLLTPFSVTSTNPGEVSEATAISIYPHNNHSILIVQQMPRGTNGQRQVSTQLTSVANINLENSGFRVHHPVELRDSPLQSPRPPPKPPVLAVIPPTPANGHTKPSHNESLPPSRKGSLKRSMSKVRRALSARRPLQRQEWRQEPSIQRSVSLRSTSVPHRTFERNDPDNRLSPFWRPRGFWDDLSDSESDFGDHDFSTGNTLSLPQKKILAGTGSLVKRLNSLRVRNRAQMKEMEGSRPREERGNARPRSQSLSRLSPMPIGWIAEIRNRFDDLQNRRSEERLEKQRMRLKQHIGPVVLHQNEW